MRPPPTMDQVVRNYEWHETAYGYRTPSKIGMGWVRDIADEIIFRPPPPPADPLKIINWGKPNTDYATSQQIWNREATLDEWTEKSIFDKAKRYGTASRPNRRWYTETDSQGNPKYMTDRMLDYMVRHWDMRENGVHILINGELVYLTGPHWYYMQWCDIGGRFPEYRDKDRYVFYVWEVVRKNPNMAGLLYVKHRRDGATFKFLSALYNDTTMTPNANSFLQSKTAIHARDAIYMEKLIPMHTKMVEFFKPMSAGYDKPAHGMNFDSPALRGSRQMDQVLGLNSRIRMAGTTTHGSMFDGQKIFRGLYDESAKQERENVKEAIATIVPTLVDGGGYWGKLLMPTTLEELKNSMQGVFRELWDNSRPSKAKTSMTGSTPSGLVGLFFPAWFGLYDKISFIGRFGESIIDVPTKEQYEWLCATYASGAEQEDFGKTPKDIWRECGAWQYLENYRAELEHDQTALLSFKRKYPFTIEEGFTLSGIDSHVNAQVVSDVWDDLHTMEAGVARYKKLMVPCVLEPLRPTSSKALPSEVLGQQMRFRPDPKGDWEVRADFLASAGEDWRPNHVKRSTSGDVEKITIMPDGDRFAIGVDPVDKDKTAVSVKSGLSDFSISILWKYDPKVDRDAEPGHQRTYAPVAKYRARKDTAEEMYLELAKACVITGSRANIENTKGEGCISFMVRHGMGGMLLMRPLSTFSFEARRAGRARRVVGTPASDDLYLLGFPLVRRWVTNWASANNSPFRGLWSDFRDVNPKDMQPFDDFVSFMLALFVLDEDIVVAQPDKIRDIGSKEVKASQGPVVRGFKANIYRIRR